MCFAALRRGAAATEDELHAQARESIAQRPPRPKRIHTVDAILLTSVGKIYKPQLRCDAATQLVTQVVCEQLALPGVKVQVQVQVQMQMQMHEGGRRGMTVRVTLPATAAAAVPMVQSELAACLFEAEVGVV